MSVATANGSGSHNGTSGRGATSAEHDRILSAVAQTSDDAMFTTSPDGRVTSWSGPAERLFGHSAESIIGLDVAHPIGEPQR
ncbi:MAG: PAS domain S-box protein, partial [Gemmatimonadaceae bacterium]|nr:PAS domain S-box protein [Gemmatimonadaceae bacterium]